VRGAVDNPAHCSFLKQEGPAHATQALDPHSEPARGLQYSELFLELQAAAPFFLMAGPNVIQSEAHCLKMCRQVSSLEWHCMALHRSSVLPAPRS